eukprot:TRINITY_DN6377_c0_g2_i1.p1 TRINITY_DN6377_c0_g2~~TRINITY_DN6377_c0_g2_i1.p1  ORF type:complete len:750 (+),score=266.72 TRINITY_DN6377_c0_g2_i1:129-2378(+)
MLQNQKELAALEGTGEDVQIEDKSDSDDEEEEKQKSVAGMPASRMLDGRVRLLLTALKRAGKESEAKKEEEKKKQEEEERKRLEKIRKFEARDWSRHEIRELKRMIMLFGDTWTPEQAVYLKINRPQEQIEEYKKKMISYCRMIDESGETIPEKKGSKESRDDDDKDDDKDEDEENGLMIDDKEEKPSEKDEKPKENSEDKSEKEEAKENHEKVTPENKEDKDKMDTEDKEKDEKDKEEKEVKEEKEDKEDKEEKEEREDKEDKEGGKDGEKKKDKDEKADPLIQSINSLITAKRIIGRIDLLSKLREIMKLPEGEMKTHLQKSNKMQMPIWWIPYIHDFALLKIVHDHGLGTTSVLRDPSNDFCSGGDLNSASYITKMKFLQLFLEDKAPLLSRLKYLIRLISECAHKRRKQLEHQFIQEQLMKQKEQLRTKKKKEKQNLLKEKKAAQRIALPPKLPEKEIVSESDSDMDGKKKRKRPDAEPKKTRKPPTRIEFESFDDIKLPLTVKGGTTIIELGVIQPDKPAFHQKAYIYPLGFESIKKMGSIVNENATTIYHSKIEDAGGNPKFVVWAEDAPEQIYHNSTSSGVWTEVLKRIKKKTVSVSGPEMFGLSDPTVQKLIQDLPGARECKNYLWKEINIKRPVKLGLPSSPISNAQSDLPSSPQSHSSSSSSSSNSSASFSSHSLPEVKKSKDDVRTNEVYSESGTDDEPEQRMEIDSGGDDDDSSSSSSSSSSSDSSTSSEDNSSDSD